MTTAGTIAHALGALFLLAAGCQNPGTTLVHAGEDPLPDLEPPAAAPLARDGGAVSLDGSPAALLPPAGAGTSSADRARWRTVTVAQPRGQVEVQPTYYALFEGFSEGPRATGRHPTEKDALRTGEERASALADGVAQPAIGILWMASVPGQVIVLPPWTVRRQPDGIEWLPPAGPAAGAKAVPSP